MSVNFLESNRIKPSGFLLAAIAICLVLAFTQFVKAQEDEEEFVQEGLVASESTDINSDPVKLFLEGQKAHERGELDKALELYTKALAAYPEFPEAEYQRGMIYRTRGNWKEAENSFRKAVEYRRDWTLAMSNLGAALVRNAKYSEAGIVLDKAIRLDGHNIPAYIALTDLYLVDPPDVSRIKALYSRLVYLTTKAKIPAGIWACRGAMERVLGNLKDAEKSIARSLIIEPENKRGLLEEIEIAIAKSDYTGATELAQNLVRRFPDEVGAKMLLARGLALGGDKEKAIDVLTSIENPDLEVVQLLSAIRTAGNFNLEELEAELNKKPDDINILGKLCGGLRIDNPEKALRYCERAYRQEQDNIAHAVGFGAALVQLRQFGRATKLLEQIKLAAPDNHTVRANLATAYFSTAEFEKAKTEYLWITKTRPELPGGYYFLAITHDRLTEYVDAMANYQKFLRLADKNQFELEIDRVRLRMPLLQKQIDKGMGKKRED